MSPLSFVPLLYFIFLIVFCCYCCSSYFPTLLTYPKPPFHKSFSFSLTVLSTGNSTETRVTFPGKSFKNFQHWTVKFTYSITENKFSIHEKKYFVLWTLFPPFFLCYFLSFFMVSNGGQMEKKPIFKIWNQLRTGHCLCSLSGLSGRFPTNQLHPPVLWVVWPNTYYW